MTWQNLRGHREQIEMFRRSLNRGRLAHAYLFAGAEGIGKRLFAHLLAQSLLCTERVDALLEACGRCPSCRQFAAGTHPDFLPVGVPEGKSELPIELIAGSREHRGREGLCYDLSLRPMTSTRRVAVIDDADRMNEVSANALLKTLEEPPDYATLILIASDADLLLPTIRSRCQLVRFSPLADDDLAALLVEQGLAENVEAARALAQLCEGSITPAAQLARPELGKLRETLFASLSRSPYDSAATSHKILEQLDELGGEAHVQRTAAGWIVRLIVEYYRAGLRQGVAAAKALIAADASQTTGLERTIELIERASISERQLEQNVSVPLCLETLFADLGRLLRTA